MKIRLNREAISRITQLRAGSRECGAIAAALMLTAVATGCAHPTDSTLSSSPSSNQVSLGSPMVAPHEVRQPTLQPLPVPNLIPATPIGKRLPEVAVGRSDPFAALQMAPTVVIRPSPVLPTPAVTTATLPYSTQAPARPLIPLPTFQAPAGTLSDPSIPTLPPISLVQAIEVSGVVQTGSNTSIIVKVPEEHTTRYVGVGDRLANGRVLVKRVEMGAEPVVILEQDGRETVKSIGGGAAIGAL